MQVDLSGLRALVTGSTKGIGFAVAQKLAASGAEAERLQVIADVVKTEGH